MATLKHRMKMKTMRKRSRKCRRVLRQYKRALDALDNLLANPPEDEADFGNILEDLLLDLDDAAERVKGVSGDFVHRTLEMLG